MSLAESPQQRSTGRGWRSRRPSAHRRGRSAQPPHETCGRKSRVALTYARRESNRVRVACLGSAEPRAHGDMCHNLGDVRNGDEKFAFGSPLRGPVYHDVWRVSMGPAPRNVVH